MSPTTKKNIINNPIITENNNMIVLTLDYLKARPVTPPVGITCSCMCKNCGSGPLAPGAHGQVKLCASCRR